MLTALAPAMAIGTASQAAPAFTTNSDRIVVMISIDGLAAHYFDDPKAEMPTIRSLAAAGARAKSMKASNPTVTWPNHTTLVTGVTPARHGVIGNNYLDRTTGKRVTLIADPVFDKDEIVKVPTLYDLAKSNGMQTAAIRWPATRNAKTLDWSIPDVSSVELTKRFGTPALLAECEKAGISLEADEAAVPAERVRKPTDKQATGIFIHILRVHRPQLALLHVENVDHMQHLNGPRSAEAYAAIKAADGQVRAVWEELQRDFPGKATLFVVSDHGFSAIKRLVLPNVALRKAGLLDSGKKSADAVQTVVQGGSAFIYVRDEPNRSKIIKQVKKAFAGMKGISKVVDSTQFQDYGVANPKDDSRAPDLILFADDGCAFGDTAAGDLPFEDKPERKGSHGHDASLPNLHATFVACGVGIKPGVKLDEIANTSVAPTIAKLLGIALPNVDGKPLDSAMTQ